MSAKILARAHHPTDLLQLTHPKLNARIKEVSTKTADIDQRTSVSMRRAIWQAAGDGIRLFRRRLRSLHVGFLDSTQSVADRPERSKFVCLHPEAVDVRRISGVGRFFGPHREIVIKMGLLRPVHGIDIRGDVPGLLDRKCGLIVGRSIGHVAVNEIGGCYQPGHAGAIPSACPPE
jgi:hypothetical protein